MRVAELMGRTRRTSVGLGSGAFFMSEDDVPSGPSADTWPGESVGRPDRDPAQIGRFRVRRRLGSGGMGIVYACRDEDLGRTVAIKLLLDDGQDLEVHRDRLKREAQVMARLSHPNVVPVFEVGEYEGSVFVVMEYVRGATLREWVDEDEPRWDEILEAFLQAGRGVAAAHAAGIVHRDFKPENVLRSTDGRVMVVDFGLARALSLHAGGPQRSSLGAARRYSAPPTLTGAGARVGTPGYISPEQIRGERGDAMSDQFAFAVALWEALYGEHPFGVRAWPALAVAIVGGELQMPAHPGAVPPRIQRVLQRALRPNAAERWPTIEACLEELRRAAWPGGRRRFLAAGIGAIGLLAASAIGYSVGRTETIAGCDGPVAVAEIWNDERRQELRRRFTVEGQPHVARAWDRVEVRLDAWSEGWRALHEATCKGHDELSREALGLRHQRAACLDEATDSLAELVEVARHLDPVRFANADAGLSADLQDLSWCSTDAAVQQRPVAPTESRERIHAARSELRRAAVLRLAGAGEQADVLLQALPDRAAAIDFPPLHAEVALARARARALDSAAERTEALEVALLQAEASGHTHVAIEALVDLADLAARAHLHREADRYLQRVDAAVVRVGAPAGLVRRVRGRRVEIEELLGRIEQAIALEAEHVADLETDETNGLEAARARLRLSRLEMQVPDRDPLPNATAAIAMYEAVLGPEHPESTHALGTRAEIYDGLARMEHESAERAARWQRAGRDDDARIIDILRRTHAEAGHPALAGALHRQAFRQFDSGASYELGISWSREAVDVAARTLGPAHPQTQSMRYYAARIRHALGRTEELMPMLDALIAAHAVLDTYEPVDAFGMRAVLKARLGEIEPAGADLAKAAEIADALAEAGDLRGRAYWAEWAAEVAEARGDSVTALAFAELAAVLWHTTDPERRDRNADRTAGRVGTRVGQLRVRLGALEAARDPLLAVLREADGRTVPSAYPYLPDAAYALAQVELARDDIAAARQLGRRAHAGLAALGPGRALAREEVHRWLASLPPEPTSLTMDDGAGR